MGSCEPIAYSSKLLSDRMKPAIVCDWLVTSGGAERVIDEIQHTFPSAPLLTTVRGREGLPSPRGAWVTTTPLQNLYRIFRHHQILAPLMPRAIESLDVRRYDVVLSSSHAVGKGVIPPPHALHICYCHTPMRYAWFMEEEYLRDFGLRGPLRLSARKVLKALRRWDLTTSRRVDLFLANSLSTRERIQRVYGRESIVLHPPVDDRFFETTSYKLQATSSPYYLAVGRLVPYKRFDLLVDVANRLLFPLKITGEGRELSELKRRAGPTVEFLGRVKDVDLPSLYAGATALLFPTHEDAGIVPLEAQACGTPVVALGRGGVLDTVRDGVTGVLFHEQTSDALEHAMRRCEALHVDRHTIREHARQFSASRFREKLRGIVREAYERHRAHLPR